MPCTPSFFLLYISILNIIPYLCQNLVNTLVFTIQEDNLCHCIFKLKFKCDLENLIKFTNGGHDIQAYFPLNYVRKIMIHHLLV
jgi:hypothetical protein